MISFSLIHSNIPPETHAQDSREARILRKCTETLAQDPLAKIFQKNFPEKYSWKPLRDFFLPSSWFFFRKVLWKFLRKILWKFFWIFFRNCCSSFYIFFMSFCGDHCDRSIKIVASVILAPPVLFFMNFYGNFSKIPQKYLPTINPGDLF